MTREEAYKLLVAEDSGHYGVLFFLKHPEHPNHNYGMDDLAFQIFREEEHIPGIFETKFQAWLQLQSE